MHVTWHAIVVEILIGTWYSVKHLIIRTSIKTEGADTRLGYHSQRRLKSLNISGTDVSKVIDDCYHH